MTSHESNFTCSGCHECTCSQVVEGNLTNATALNSERRYPYLCTCYDFVIEAVLVGALCVLGLIGNAVSIVCLAADKTRTATPFLLISLELTDTLFLVSVFPLRVLTSIHTFAAKIPSFGSIQPYIGKYVYPTALLAETGSIYLTILVTLNRYISVCHPYRATNLCSINFARRHVVVVGLFSVVFNLPRFFEYEVVHKYSHGVGGVGSHLHKNWIIENRVYRIVYSNVLYFVVMFLLPLVSLTILNIRLVMALRTTRTRRARLLRHSTGESSSSSWSSSLSSGRGFSRSEEDITLMLIVVVMVFVVTQTPAMITQVLLGSFGDESLDCPHAFFFFERLSDLLVVANSSINFIIYCFCSRRFRQILFRLMTGREPGSLSRSSVRTTLHHARTTQRTGAVAVTTEHGVCQLCSSL